MEKDSDCTLCGMTRTCRQGHMTAKLTGHLRHVLGEGVTLPSTVAASAANPSVCVSLDRADATTWEQFGNTKSSRPLPTATFSHYEYSVSP